MVEEVAGLCRVAMMGSWVVVSFPKGVRGQCYSSVNEGSESMMSWRITKS